MQKQEEKNEERRKDEKTKTIFSARKTKKEVFRDTKIVFLPNSHRNSSNLGKGKENGRKNPNFRKSEST